MTEKELGSLSIGEVVVTALNISSGTFDNRKAVIIDRNVLMTVVPTPTPSLINEEVVSESYRVDILVNGIFVENFILFPYEVDKLGNVL